MRMGMNFEGFKNMYITLEKAEEKLKQATRRATIENALHLLSLAMQQAPIYLGEIDEDGNLKEDEDGNIIKTHTGGKLRASGTVVHKEIPIATGTESGSIKYNMNYNKDTEIVERKVEVLVGFNTVYAFRQHEELEYRHIDGKAKYLEDPLKENAEKFKRRVQEEVRKVLQEFLREE